MNYGKTVESIRQVHEAAQTATARSINQVLTVRNWLIGAYIFEFEQNGEDRAAYGEKLIRSLADDFSRNGLEGLSTTNLKYCRLFALAYPLTGIGQTVSDQFENLRIMPVSTESQPVEFRFPALAAKHAGQPSLAWQDAGYYRRLIGELTWSHLLELARIDDPVKRAFYEVESLKSRWTQRDLKRQINSLLFERVGLSPDKAAVLTLAAEGQALEQPRLLLRDPYVLEFLGIEQATFSESELEQALIDHLQDFILELGRDFCFMERQFKITVGGRHHYLDLLFFHRRLRCLFAIDLKLGAFQHEDAGQMNFYLNYLQDQVAFPDENPPIGLILCAEKDAEEVHYATAGLSQQLFVSRYKLALPSEEQLKQWLREEQAQLQMRLEKQTDL
ncbi:MAG: PDDEXK nuclease domain-containing protein [Blastocatellia bacterium]|nr:PDDEXK nuclease domain-containing protein [Blastocatellia bacterium]